MKARVFGLFFGFMLILGAVTNVRAAGYVCDSIKYTSCGAGFYMTLNGSANSTSTTGNACTTCPSDAEYCPGGTYAPAYKVTLNANGGTGGTTAIYRVQNVGWFSSLKKSTTPATSLSGIGDPFSTLPSKPTRTGYTFNGFYDATSGGTQTITSAGVVSASNAYGTATWYAQWTATRYKITLNGNGAAAAPITGCTIDGNVSKAYYVYDTTKFVCETGNSTTLTSLPVPSRTGYKFKGYYSAASGGKQITDASGALINKNFTTTDMTIYAQWEPITFTVIYVANGGSGTQMDNTKCTYDSDCYITKNTYTKTGYTFKNWADSDNSKTFSDGENVKNAKTTSGATLFLYAQWQAVSKTCAVGQYFNVTECADCTSGYYCPNGSKTYTYNGSIQGRSTCPTIYTKSDAKATAQTQCYVTTTAGNYIANANDSTQTKCDTNYYCPSTKVYYGSTGGKLACPTPTADNAPEMPSDYTVRSVIFADWLNINLTSMDQCRATFTFNNNKGVVTYEAVKYDTSTNKYGSSTTSIYWSKVNAGYYLYTRYSDDYCEKALAEGKSRSMIYRNVADCPIGSYCPGISWVPNCSSGTYENTYGKYACPENSWTNDGAGNAFCTCYTGYNYNGGTTTTSDACVANTYTIVYNSNGGSAVSNTSCTYGQTCTVSSITPTKTGYTFNGWLYNGKTYTPGQDVKNITYQNGETLEFTAQWTVNEYPCAAGKYLDGTTCKTCESGYYCPGDTYTYNAGIQGRSTCPTIYNNSDAGASSNKQCYIITEAGKMIPYPSSGTEVTCSANYYCSGGVKIYYGEYGGSSACPANSSTNGATGQTKCTCNTGYNYNGGTTTASDACAANIYTIVYNSNGGSAVSSTSCTYGQTCTISGITPTKTGYTFNGWDIGGDTYAAGQSVSNLIDTNNGTVTLVAQWTANTYTIVYNPNGGSAVSSTLCTYGQTCTISNTVPTKTGYTFAGWNYASTTYQAGAGVSNLASANGDSVTFTAQWSTNARTCEPGKYLDGDDCKTCPVNSYCGGGTWEYNGGIQGLKKCPANSSTNGATGQTTCVCDEFFTLTGEKDGEKVTAGDKCELVPGFVVTTVDYAKDFNFKLNSLGRIYVDWGDESDVQVLDIENTQSGEVKVSHIYETAGKYDIKITGRVTGYTDRAIYFSDNKNIKSVSGKLGSVFGTLPDGTVPSFQYLFQGCSNLQSISSDLFDGVYGTPKPWMFYHAFSNCTSLESVPGNLFNLSFDTTSDYMFGYTFAGCTGLKSIPENLFAALPAVAKANMFDNTFYKCSGLTEIPERLFDFLDGADAAEKLFSNTFSNCAGVQTIPAGLFAGLAPVAAQNMFQETFKYCTSLTEIPYNLFAFLDGAQPQISMFAMTFLGCSGLKSIPEDLFANVKGAPAPGMFWGTFSECTGLSSIPENLFSTIKGAPAELMFAGTFLGCKNLKGYVPQNLFAGIDKDTTVTSQMTNVFLDTGLETQCPNDMYQYMTGFEEYFDGKVACAFCPEIDETYGAVSKDLLDVIANEPHKSIDECRATFGYAPQWYLDYLKEQGETTEDILAGYDPQANNRGMYYVSCDYNPETQQYDSNCTGVPMFCDAGYVSDTKKSIFDENINPDDILVYATSPQDAIEKTCVPVGRNNWSSSVKICMNLPDEEIMSCTLNATKARNACPDGLRTVGYGKGADEENDCGRILHIDESVVYLRKDRRTVPSLCVRVDGVVYYGSMSKQETNMNDKSERKLRINYKGVPYWVHDDGVL